MSRVVSSVATADADGAADAAFVQLHVLAAELLAGRRVLLAGDRTGAGAELLSGRGEVELVATVEPSALLDAAAAHDAIVCLDGLEDAEQRDALLDALVNARPGTAVVLSVPGAEERSSAAAGGMAYEEAHAAAARFPDGLLLLQSAADGSLLQPAGDAPARTLEAALLTSDGLDPEHAERYVIVAGLGTAIAATSGRAIVRATMAPSSARTVRRLETANAELVRANARLGRATRGHSGAAAVAALTRLREKEEHAAAAVAEAREETAATQRRLADVELAGEQRAEALTARAEAAEARLGAVEARAEDAERRVVEVEQRAVEAEQRVGEVEQRALDAERQASDLETALLQERSRRSVRAAQRLSRLLRR